MSSSCLDGQPAPDIARLYGRRFVASVPTPTVHLGFFEGERKRHCHGYDETYGALHAVLSLITVIFSLFGAALLLGFL